MKNRSILKRIIIFLFILFATDRLIGLLLMHGITTYFDLNRHVDYVFSGTSVALFAVDRDMLEREMHANIGFPVEQGFTNEDRLVMLRYFLSVNKSPLKGVVYELTPNIFTSEGLSSNSYQLLYPFMDNPMVGDYIRKNCHSKAEYYLRRVFLTPRFIEGTFNYSIRGLLNRHESVRSGKVDITRIRRQALNGSFRKIAFDNDCISTFNQTMQVINKKGIKGFYIFYPTVDIFNDIQKEKYRKVISMVDTMVKKSGKDKLLNFNPDFVAHYELFSDPIHLNNDGRKEFTIKLAKTLTTVLYSGMKERQGNTLNRSIQNN